MHYVVTKTVKSVKYNWVHHLFMICIDKKWHNNLEVSLCFVVYEVYSG